MPEFCCHHFFRWCKEFFFIAAAKQIIHLSQNVFVLLYFSALKRAFKLPDILRGLPWNFVYIPSMLAPRSKIAIRKIEYLMLVWKIHCLTFYKWSTTPPLRWKYFVSGVFWRIVFEWQFKKIFKIPKPRNYFHLLLVLLHLVIKMIMRRIYFNCVPSNICQTILSSFFFTKN